MSSLCFSSRNQLIAFSLRKRKFLFFLLKSLVLPVGFKIKKPGKTAGLFQKI